MSGEHRYSFVCPVTSEIVSIPSTAVTQVGSVPSDAIYPQPLIPATERLDLTRNESGGWILIHPEFPGDGIPFSLDDYVKYQAGGNVWRRDMLLREFAPQPKYAELLQKWGIKA
jgi:hypothetical protein